MKVQLFRVKLLRTVVSARIVIVKADDRIEAESKALEAAGKLEYAQRMPNFRVDSCAPVDKNAIEIGATIIE